MGDGGPPAPAPGGLPPVAALSPQETSSPPGIAAFDFDGTLVAGDSLVPFLQGMLGTTAFARSLAGCAPAMAAGYRSAGRDGAKAALLARIMVDLEWSEVADHAQRFAETLAGRVRPTMAERIGWHRERGHHVVMVSASLAAYLEPVGRMLGFDHVIATQLEVDAITGLLTGRLSGPNVRGAAKAELLGALLEELASANSGNRPEVWAYGDSPGDREMLAMADHPHLVEPASRRLARWTSSRGGSAGTRSAMLGGWPKRS